ncbi:MAG: sensor histidine kinase [Alphaproteobacteria bacterium]|nr:sensor histidine kinase [Alphaproteobacteria bacterium]
MRDADRRLAWVNTAYADSVDAAKSQVVADQIELAGPLLPADSGTASRAADTGSPACAESRHIVIGGERRLVQLTETPCALPADPHDGWGGTLGYALDQTAVDEAVRERDRHIAAHANVLENLKSAIAIFGPDKRLSFFNTAYVQLWGFDEAWLETHPTLGEVLEDLRERRRLPEFADFGDFRQSQLGLFTALIAPDEDWMHLPDGTTLRVLITPHPFGGLMFVLEDVTTALTLERNYNTLMAVQRESLDNLAEGIAVYGDDGRLQLSNPVFRTIWALQPEDLQGNPHISEVLDRTRSFFDNGVDWEAARAEMIAWALEREPRTGKMDRADGSILQFSTVPLPDGAVLHSYLDVTDSAKVEQALRASNQALETADRLKSEFIANVSYQLRTPLNAIMGFAEILDNQYFGPLNDRQTEYTRSIVDASRRLLALINDILDIATIEAGYMALELKQVRVEDLLRGVYDLTREWAAKQSLQIAVDCPAEVGSIEADDRRLKQALYNLVSNSVKFTPPGGRIVLSAWRQENEIGMVVGDTGIGIPREDQDRVFGRFERGHSHLRQSGVGLGLALVKSFIEMHGGRITLKSAPGLGTTVTCIVPAHPLAAYTGAVQDGSGLAGVLPFPTLIPPPD